MKKIFTYIAFIFLAAALPQQVFARTLPAGFSKDQIWFSKDPFFAGDNILISTLIYNSSEYRMEGSVILKDGTSTVQKRTFAIEKGDAQVINFPWLATSGTHNFSALIERNEFITGTSSLTASPITTSETAKVRRFADYDLNNNGVGDSTEPTPAKKLPTSSPLTLPVNPIKTVEQTIVDKTPEPVASVAIPVIGGVESLRMDQAGKSAKNLDYAEGAITARLGVTTQALQKDKGGRSAAGWSLVKDGVVSGKVFRTPFDYIKLFLALVTHFITTNPYIFYILLTLVFYKLIRLAIGLFM